MRKKYIPPLMAASAFLMLANLTPAYAADLNASLFSNSNAVSEDVLGEIRALGPGTAATSASASSQTGGGGDGGGEVSFGSSTFSNFAGANNNAFATAPGASAVATMTINVYLGGSID